MDIHELAKNVLENLTPYLPYLIAGGKIAAKKAFEEAGKRFVDSAWDKAEEIWGKVKPKTDSKTIERIERKPEDPRVLGHLEVELEEVFEQDASFADEMARVVVQGNSGIVVGENVQDANLFNNSNHNQAANNVIGNVYQTAVIHPDPEKDRQKKLFENYLKRLHADCDQILLTTLGSDKNNSEKVSLARVYIQLDTTTMKKSPKKDDDKKGRTPDEIPVSAWEAAEAAKKIIFVGGAGSGKSSFVKNLIGMQCRALLDPREPKTFLGGLLPVYVELRRLKLKLDALDLDGLSKPDEMRALWGAVMGYIREEAQAREMELPQALEEALQNGAVTVVLDGLDEVPRSIRPLVQKTAQAVAAQNIQRILITSRPNGYVEFGGFQRYDIAELDEPKIRNFARAWYEEHKIISNLSDAEVKENSEKLASKATQSDLLELAEIPMTLTCMAIIHATDKAKLPEQKTRLFDRLVSIFSGKWERDSKGSIDVSPALGEVLKQQGRLRDILERLAYETHLAGYEEYKRNNNKNDNDAAIADLSEGKAYELLIREEVLGSRELAGEFLRFIQERSGLFSSRGGANDSYYFAHRSIQEYLAGCRMFKSTDFLGKYNEHAAQEDFWSVAALLGVEDVIHSDNNQPKYLIYLLLAELCPMSKLPRKMTEAQERALLWGAKLTMQIRREELNAYTKEKISYKDYFKWLEKNLKNLMEHGKYLLPYERADAADILDQLGYTPADLHTFVPITNYQSPIYFSKYLVTNEQYARFLKAENFQNKALWCDFEKFDENSEPMQETWGEEAWNWLKERLQQNDEDVKDGVLMPRYWNNPHFGGSRRNAPVVGISWHEANAYCKWLTANWQKEPEAQSNSAFIPHHSSFVFRLPHEKEWVFAAGGEENNRFAFGELKGAKKEIVNFANTAESGINRTTPVWMYPQGASKPYGLMDMSGNVWEWQANFYNKDHALLAWRGGSWVDYEADARVSFRDPSHPLDPWNSYGFRVLLAFPSNLL